MLAWADQVVADFPFTASAAIKAKRPFWLSTHNVETNLLKGWQQRRMRAIENRAAHAAKGIVCCSRDDAAHFAQLVPGKPLVYVPNGLRDDRFAGLAAERARIRAELGFADGERVLLFTASNFAPNVEALEHFLLPFIRANESLFKRMRLHVLVVGSVTRTGWREPHVTVTGKVPRVEPYFAAADYALNATLRGSGTNVKMGEYMAAGLPILTSDAGLRGYDLTPGEDCLLFEPRTFAEVLGSTWLFDDPARAKAMAVRAYEKNRAQISMKEAIRPLVAALS